MQTEQLPFIIQNQAKDNSEVEILIYDAIPSYDEDWRMKNTADRFVQAFKKLDDSFATIRIRINSPGGSVYHGFPIFNAIKSAKAHTITHNDGLAASMAGLIFLAGKERKTARNGILMIHSALSAFHGNSKAMKKHTEILDTFDGIIAQLLSDHSILSVEEVKEKYMNYEDHFLNSDTAKDLGFVTEIEEYESQNPPPKNISAFGHSQIMALYNSGKPNPTVPTKPTIPMNFDDSVSEIAKSLTAENAEKVLSMINATLGENSVSSKVEVDNAVALATKPLSDTVVLKDQEITALKSAEIENTKKLQVANAEVLRLKEELTKLPNNAGQDPGSPADFEFLSETDMALRAKQTTKP
jgi:ATP-dependent protease ClpP protease subunit